MDDAEVTSRVPALRVRVGLEPDLRRAADGRAGVRLAAELAAFAASLGVPVTPRCELVPLDAARPDGDGAMVQVWFGDQGCRCSLELLARSMAVVDGVQCPPLDGPVDLVAWLHDRLGPGGGEPAGQRLTRFLGYICLELLASRPSMLLTDDSAGVYLAAVVPDGEPPGTRPPWLADRTLLRSSLARVLDLGVSLADRAAVRELLVRAAGDNLPVGELSETIAAGLGEPSVRLLVEPGYLRALLADGQATLRTGLEHFASGIFEAVGLPLPEVSVIPSERLPPGCFAVSINQVVGLPWVGRPIEGDRVGGDGKAASSDPQTTGDALLYLVFGLMSELRERGGRLLLASVVERELTAIEATLPNLVAAARDVASIPTLTSVLRGLVDERISIRDSRTILQAIVDFDVLVTDPERNIVLGDFLPISITPDERNRHELLAAHVRSSMKEYLTHKYSKGRSQIDVYLLDPATEQLVVRYRDTQGQAVRERILEAVRRVVAAADSDVPPAFLTTTELRLSLRKALNPEFAQYPVLAYRELEPSVLLRPIGKVRPVP